MSKVVTSKLLTDHSGNCFSVASPFFSSLVNSYTYTGVLCNVILKNSGETAQENKI